MAKKAVKKKFRSSAHENGLGKVKKNPTRKKAVRKPLPPGVYGYTIDEGLSPRNLRSIGVVTGRTSSILAEAPRKVVDYSKPPKTLKQANEIIEYFKCQNQAQIKDLDFIRKQHENDMLRRDAEGAKMRADYMQTLADRLLNALNAKVTYQRVGETEIGSKE